MSNTLKINFKGRDEREQALINTVNALVDMVCNTRLPQTQKDIVNNKTETDGEISNIQSDIDYIAIMTEVDLDE